MIDDALRVFNTREYLGRPSRFRTISTSHLQSLLSNKLKELFPNLETEDQLLFDSKETVDAINGCLIQAFPSHHLDAVTCLTNLAIVFLINITGMHKSKAHRTM